MTQNSNPSIKKLSSDPASYYATAREAFNMASDGVGRIDHYFKIAGLTIRLCFAGPVLVPLLIPALHHLSVPSVASPDLTVFLWDRVSTGIPIPCLPWRANIREEGKHFNSGHVKIIFQNEHIKISYQPGKDTYSILGRSSKTAIYYTEDAFHISQYEKGSPLLAILHWWVADYDRYLIHAGAVGNDDGGALLIGKGGSGKSTTSFACLNSDMSYISDDYCLISNVTVPYVYSLYCSGKVNVEDIGKFPFLDIALRDTDDSDWGKALYIISDYRPEKISHGFPIKAIFITQVTGGPETGLERATPPWHFVPWHPVRFFNSPERNAR